MPFFNIVFLKFLRVLYNINHKKYSGMICDLYNILNNLKLKRSKRSKLKKCGKLLKTKTLRNFFVITFAWTWILWMPFVLPTFGLYEMTETLEGLVMLAVLLGAFGPLISAMILTYRDGGKGKVKQYFRKCLNFKIKPIYYLMAIVLV